jgi:hypothetical protein
MGWFLIYNIFIIKNKKQSHICETISERQCTKIAPHVNLYKKNVCKCILGAG